MSVSTVETWDRMLRKRMESCLVYKRGMFNDMQRSAALGNSRSRSFKPTTVRKSPVQL
jgi:hypothetical protein